jgi:hypothetical protein
MKTEVRLKVAMAVRVRNFLREHPFGAPKADQVVTRFEARVSRALLLLEQQRDGDQVEKAALRRCREVRRALRREPLKHLVAVAVAAASEKPELLGLFKLPDANVSKQEFLADARTLLTRATAHKDLLLEHGLREDLIDKLTADLAAYDQHSAAADAGLRAHTGARSELTAIASELIRMVKQLDGMMLPRIREVPELGGSWASARNVAWPNPEVKGPPANQHGTGQADRPAA